MDDHSFLDMIVAIAHRKLILIHICVLDIMAKRWLVSSSFQVIKGRVFAMVGIGKNTPIDGGSYEKQDPGGTFVIHVAIIKIRLYQEQTILLVYKIILKVILPLCSHNYIMYMYAAH